MESTSERERKKERERERERVRARGSYLEKKLMDRQTGPIRGSPR